ncbi:hypothetical protein [Hymenobacter rubidus]|uniref:hypothetical protein n=1 Tax=Hymenobacter rubidus TaxID=1441626 RepID=UPI00191DE44C|nr:hypothetical protein [Hymenobacter rubidus]
MTHFRFRYKRVGYMRWRCRTASRRAILIVLPLTAAARFKPSTAAWRRTVPVFVPIQVPSPVLVVGDFVVGEEADPQLVGHPDIRY